MLRLYDWAPSPFCHKVRAVLDHKGLAYERLSANAASLQELVSRGASGKVPALDLDGQLIEDSTAIALALDRLQPEPPLIPEGRREAALCRALEDWADEAIYLNALYHHWAEPAGQAQTAAYFTAQGPQVAPLFEPLLARTLDQLAGHGTSRRSPAAILADTATQIETAAGLLERGPFLLGDRAWLCDFALAAQLLYLSRAPATRPIVERNAAIQAFLSAMRAPRR